MKIVKIILFIFIFPLLTTQMSFGHSGGLNSQGCHNNTKTGDYHCHRSSSSSSSSKSNSSSTSKKNTCRITIGSQYFEFDPTKTYNKQLNFDANDGKVKITCK